MKESEMKTKKCPHHLAAQAIQNQSIVLMTILAALPTNQETMNKAIKTVGALIEKNSNHLCDGSGCAMWEPEYDQENIEEKETQNDKDGKPEGEGWFIASRHRNHSGPDTVIWQRYVPNDCGDCGLKTKELDCRASC